VFTTQALAAEEKNKMVPQLELGVFHKKIKSTLPNFSKETTGPSPFPGLGYFKKVFYVLSQP
jgi:hypothetical protein